jgi:tetratricopeptide (TPR) repeat protein
MTRRAKITSLVVASIGAVVVGVALFLMVTAPKTEVVTDDKTYKEIAQQVETLRNEPVPQDAEQRAIYFSQVAEKYERLRDFAAARDYYKQAQAAVDAASLHDQVVYYEDIARTYEQEGNTAEARVYFEKQKTHLQDFLREHPEDEPTKRAIESIEAKLR